MKNEKIRQKLKSLGAFLVILFLFPYVVTVFIHGKEIRANGNDAQIYVNVKDVSVNGEQQVTEMPWDEYFIGILAKETSAEAEPEFLKAQAVLIRTKLYQILDADLAEGNETVFAEQYLKEEDMEKRQIQFDYETYYDALKKAVDETANQVLFYQGTYAYVPFHQSSNGMTRSYQEVTGQDNYPYLTVRECPQDKEAEDELQIHTLSYEEVQKKCQPFLVAVNEKDAKKTYKFSDFQIISYDSANYVSQMQIGETTCTGEQFREALSLPSSSFSIKDVDGELQIRTMGNGHGLGMSQWTANEMAKEGKTYEEILEYFFEGTELTDGGDIQQKFQ